MIGYSYTFRSPREVFESVSHISQMWIDDIFLVSLFLGGTFFMIFIFLPGYIIAYRHMQDQKKKKSKKRLLTQILLQKEIEDEVEEEIKLEEKNKNS